MSTEGRPARYRDGIPWGILAAVIPIFAMNPLVLIFTTFVFTGIAGYRGKSFRPAVGAVATVLVIAAASGLLLYHSLSGINR